MLKNPAPQRRMRRVHSHSPARGTDCETIDVNINGGRFPILATAYAVPIKNLLDIN
jgi:hypothetical protein